MLRTCAEDDAFGRRIHDAELAYTLFPVAARTALAENYVGVALLSAGPAHDGRAGEGALKSGEAIDERTNAQ